MRAEYSFFSQSISPFASRLLIASFRTPPLHRSPTPLGRPTPRSPRLAGSAPRSPRSGERLLWSSLLGQEPPWQRARGQSGAPRPPKEEEVKPPVSPVNPNGVGNRSPSFLWVGDGRVRCLRGVGVQELRLPQGQLVLFRGLLCVVCVCVKPCFEGSFGCIKYRITFV